MITLFNLASPKIYLAAYTAGENIPNLALFPIIKVLDLKDLGLTKFVGENASVRQKKHINKASLIVFILICNLELQN